MYTLHFSPGSCSLIIGCLLEELDVRFESHRVGRWLEPSALRMPNIEAFFRRMVERPAIGRAMRREGIPPWGA